MRNSKAFSVFAAIMLTGAFFVSGTLEAFAARTVISATVNGVSAVSVSGGATIASVVTVQTTGSGRAHDWQSTGWRISASNSGTFTCVNTGVHTAAGTYTANFNAIAPSAAGTYSAYFRAYSGTNCTSESNGAVSPTFTLANAVKVVAIVPSLAILPASLPTGTVGVAYAQSLTASSSAAGTVAWSVAGTLPPGLTLGPVTGNATTLSGTPALSGSYSFSIKATKGTASSTNNYSVTIGPALPPPSPVLSINPVSLPSGTAGIAYFQTMTASTTAAGPFTWSVSSGNLPAGLSLGTSTGIADFISGIPATAASSSFTIKATNGASSGTRAYAINILPPLPPPQTTSTLTVNVAENGGTATASDFTLNVINGTTTLFSGSGTSSHSYILNVGSSFSVTEATSTNSAAYGIALGSNCSGTIGTSTVVCAITNTFVVPPPPPVNLIANPSVESATVNAQLPDHWNKGGWGTNTAQLNYPVPGVNNGVGVNVTISSYTNGDAKWYFDPVPVTPGATYLFSDAYNSNAASQILAQFTLSDNSLSYVWLASPASTNGAWTNASLQFSAPLNAVSVTIFHLLYSAGSLTTDNYSLSFLSAPGANALSTGVVSLTFDDGWQSQMDNAVPLMDAAGIHGSFYIIGNAMTDTADGYMSASTVLALQNAHGEEIGAHTMDHCDLVQLYNNSSSAKTTVGCPDGPLSAPSTAQYQIDQSRTVLQALTGAPVDTFAYPYGSGPGYPAVEGLVQSDGLVAARSVFAGFNDKSTDHYALLTEQVDSTTATSTIHAWIDFAAANKVWLTLMLHQVELSASTLTNPGNPEPEGTTKAVVQDTVAYLQSKKNAGSIVVDTVHNVMANYMK